jgi:predicted aldo/keto reductase-like oxidoreductase
MKDRKLGKSGPTVSALGLGAMGMSDMYGPADRQESLATIHAALDAGVTLIDTGDFYGMGHNETLIGEALKEIPQAVRLFDEGNLRVAVDRSYPLADAPEAHRALEAGEIIGRVVLDIP